MKTKAIEIVVAEFNKNNTAGLISTLSKCNIPDGYNVTITIITDTKRKFDAYRSASAVSTTKYKIYIDENVRICDKNIFLDILSIFQDESIALVTNIGAEVIPTDARLNINNKRIGNMIFKSSSFNNWCSAQDICDVQSIEGQFFATQCDVEWQEDNFILDEYIATVHGINLRKKGWKTVVSRTFEDKIFYDANDIKTYNEYDRLLFIKKYSLDVFPLVNILIPTFNRPDMLKVALESALSQSYKNIEIIISDNGEHESNAIIINKYFSKDSRIKYFHNNNKGFGINENFNWLIQNINPKARFISWLMDDDLLYPNKIELMVNYFLQYDDVTLVTSCRDIIDIDGNIIYGQGWNDPICRETTKYYGESIGQQMLYTLRNFIGEPTTVLMKNDSSLPRHLGWSGDEVDFVIIDFPWWLDLLSKGSLIYISEPHSAMRVHGIRDTNRKDTQINVWICWLLNIRYAWNNRIYLKSERDINIALNTWLEKARRQVAMYSRINYTSKRFDLLKRLIDSVEVALHNGYILKFDLSLV